MSICAQTGLRQRHRRALPQSECGTGPHPACRRGRMASSAPPMTAPSLAHRRLRRPRHGTRRGVTSATQLVGRQIGRPGAVVRDHAPCTFRNGPHRLCCRWCGMPSGLRGRQWWQRLHEAVNTKTNRLHGCRIHRLTTTASRKQRGQSATAGRPARAFPFSGAGTGFQMSEAWSVHCTRFDEPSVGQHPQPAGAVPSRSWDPDRRTSGAPPAVEDTSGRAGNRARGRLRGIGKGFIRMTPAWAQGAPGFLEVRDGETPHPRPAWKKQPAASGTCKTGAFDVLRA